MTISSTNVVEIKMDRLYVRGGINPIQSYVLCCQIFRFSTHLAVTLVVTFSKTCDGQAKTTPNTRLNSRMLQKNGAKVKDETVKRIPLEPAVWLVTLLWCLGPWCWRLVSSSQLFWPWFCGSAGCSSSSRGLMGEAFARLTPLCP